MDTLAQKAPEYCFESLYTWLIEVVNSTGGPVRQDRFGPDALDALLDHVAFQNGYLFMKSLLATFIEVGKTDPDAVREFLERLTDLPCETAQRLVAAFYCNVPVTFAREGLGFLLSDRRRFYLGDDGVTDTRSLILAIGSHLDQQGLRQLEEAILNLPFCDSIEDVSGLKHRSGKQQYFLLAAMPASSLSNKSRDLLGVLMRKYGEPPDQLRGITSEGGFIGSPIDDAAALKMTTWQWFRAMKKYQGAVEHRDFLRGGATQLASQLQRLAKENPDKYWNLWCQLPASLDIHYRRALLLGLADSVAPSRRVFEAIRQSIALQRPGILESIVSAIGKRVVDGIPDDLLGFLEDVVSTTQDRIVVWNSDKSVDWYNNYINTARGEAFETLVRAYRLQDTEESLKSQWLLLEAACSDDSLSLMSGAIAELIPMLRVDAARAIELFDQMVERTPAVLETRFGPDFVYWGMRNGSFRQMIGHIQVLMESASEDYAQRGAELMCVASLSTDALSEADVAEAANSSELIMNGKDAWRRGAAHVYASNASGSYVDAAAPYLSRLFDDPDDGVRRYASEFVLQLGDLEILNSRELLVKYASSRAVTMLVDQLGEYLGKHGCLDPHCALDVAAALVKNQWLDDAERRTTGDHLVRLVLHIYSFARHDETLRGRALDLFDQLMERFSASAARIVREWDRDVSI